MRMKWAHEPHELLPGCSPLLGALWERAGARGFPGSSSWKAGVAATAITPEQPMWLAGWAARRQPAAGTGTELYAKALALEDAQGRRGVLVTADLIAIPPALAQNVAAQVLRRWGLARDQLLFNASHTHTAPEVRPDKVQFFEIPAEYAARIEPFVSRLEAKLVALVGAALERLQPASLSTRLTRANFVKNRRAPEREPEQDVPVLAVAGPTGEVRSLAFGLACHNLTLPPEYCLYHADYAGVAQARLEAAFPGATALFLAGAGADQDPFPRGTLELTRQHGHALARAVRESLSQAARPVRPSLRTAFQEIALDFLPLPPRETLEAEARSDEPARRRKAQFLLQLLDERKPIPGSYPCPVQVWRLGEEQRSDSSPLPGERGRGEGKLLLLIALGGEPVADYARQFNTEFAGPQVWVVGCANDGFGYLPTRRVLREGGYEGGRSLFWSALPAPFAESVEERLLSAVRELVRTVRAC
jgi:hypothetical protein